MKEKARQYGRFGVAIFATAIVALTLAGQASSPQRTSLVTDWSSKHLIFSTPTTREGLSIASRDIRYQQQWIRRNMHPAPPTDGEGASNAVEERGAAAEVGATVYKLDPERWGGGRGGGKGRGGNGGGGNGNGKLKRDWASSLGPGSTAGVDTYPAKFNFNTTTASCANDFVVFGTSVAGAAAGAAASATGTFTANPNTGETATLTYGSSNTETLTATAALFASQTGTVSGTPANLGTATITNGATTDIGTATAAAFATATGTFSSTGMTAGQSVSIKSGSTTLTLTAASAPTGTATFTGGPAAGSNIVVGGTTYVFEPTAAACGASSNCVIPPGVGTITFTGSPAGGATTAIGGVTYTWHATCPNSGEQCVVHSGTTAQNATNLEEAINNTCGSSANCTVSGPNGSATATVSGTTVTVTNTSAAAITFTDATGVTTLSPTGGTIARSSTTNDAAALEAAINDNAGQCPQTPCFAAVGAANASATATAAGAVTTVTDTTSGSITFTKTAAAITLNPSTGTIALPATSFLVNGTAATDATNLIATINAAGNGSSVGVSAASGGSGIVTLTATTIGTGSNSIALSSVGATNFVWSGATMSGGATLLAQGSSCGTRCENFQVTNASGTALTTTQIATNLASALNGNGAAVGVAVTSGGSTVTVTATSAGTGGNAIGVTDTATNFAWTASTLAGGASLQSGNNFFALTDGSGNALATGAVATNLATAIGADAAASGVPVSAVAAGDVVTVTSTAPGSLGNGITLAETLSNFTWNHATLTGGAGQASIVAYNNLYSSCGGTVPSTLWSYFTNGTVQTSPTLSSDGTQAAFVQSSSGGVASLVLLKWAAGSATAGSPVTLTTTTASAYPGCTAPCMLDPHLQRLAPTTRTLRPYYDYSA